MGHSFRIQRQPNSPFWYADFTVWDAVKQRWQRVFKSTKNTDPNKAAAVAEKYWRAAQLSAGGGGVTGMTVDHARKVVNEIISASGLPSMVKPKGWEEWRKEWMRKQSGAITASTLANLDSQTNKFTRFLGSQSDIALANLTGQMMQDYWDWMRTTERLAYGTAMLSLGRVRAALEAAQHEGLIERNVARLVVKKGNREAMRRVEFTPKDIQALLKVADHEWRLVILVGLCTAMRLMDCVTLLWSEVQTVKGGGLVIRRMPRKTRRYGKVLTIPVVEPLLSVLQSVPMSDRHGFLCPVMATRSEHLNSREFPSLMQRAGVDQLAKQGRRKLSTKSFHSLRHTLTSWMKSAGVDRETRMAITGHERDDVHDGYTHIEQGAMTTALNAALVRVMVATTPSVAPPNSGRRRKADPAQ